MSNLSWFCGGSAAIAVVLFILSGFRIVQEYEHAIVFQLGRVVRNIKAGLN